MFFAILYGMDLNQNYFLSQELLTAQEQQIPGSLNYKLMRYRLINTDLVQEKGSIHYHYDKYENAAHKFELKFCVTGNRYCTVPDCSNCRISAYHGCSGETDTIDIFHFNFSPGFLATFVQQHNSDKKNRVLSFLHTESFCEELPVCGRKKKLLNALQETSYCSALQNVTFNSIVQELFLCSCEALDDYKPGMFSCKFLADQSGIEKMYLAREILLQHIDSLISIKELSRKVAINECYLKKGFKEVFGLTIYDFYLQQKMEHAKFLLCEEGMTVTDVAALLGYSSISHFSTAFKRQTGLKPCDLLK